MLSKTSQPPPPSGGGIYGNQQEAVMELELRDYYKIIRKRIWWIVVCILVATAATGVISYFFLQPVYEASTKLIVNKKQESTGIEQIDLNSVNMNIKLIDTYKEIIKTPAIMDKVVELHPEFKLSAKELGNLVHVNSVNNTQVMTVSVQDPSYEKAANIANAVSHVFQKEIPGIMKVDNVMILNEAKLSDIPAPVKPNPKLNIAISFVVSLMCALGLVFLLEYLDDTIKTEEDVKEVLGIPTLAIISKMKESDLGVQNPSAASKNQKVGEETTYVTAN
jgi:capsular polysaccharide biosynthesis protein